MTLKLWRSSAIVVASRLVESTADKRSRDGQDAFRRRVSRPASSKAVGFAKSERRACEERTTILSSRPKEQINKMVWITGQPVLTSTSTTAQIYISPFT